MIDILFFLLGILLFLLDISFFPALTSYHVFVDLSLFYCFHLYEIKKESSVPIFILLLLIKAVFIPQDILLPFIILYLTAYLIYIGMLHTTKMANNLTIGLTGLLFFTIEFFLFKKSTLSVYILSIFFQYFAWICLAPILAILTYYYKERIKGKGVYV
jgi:hypothetical protein